MATIDPSVDLVDLLISTLDDIQKGEWFSELADIQDYPFTRLAMQSGYGKERTGKRLTFRIADDPGNDDGHHGLYEDWDADRGDHLYEGNLPWRHIRHSFAVDSREIAMNSGDAQIIDEMAVERSAMWQRVANDVENAAMAAPVPGDLLKEVGIPYHVPWISTANGDFQGALAAGQSTWCGINTTDHPKSKVYTDKYTNPTRSDLGVKLMKCIRFINFRPAPNVKAENAGRWAIYTGNTVLQNLETMAAEQNDQLGFDIGVAMDATVLKRTALQWVPQLDANAAANSNPIYVINHNYLYPAFLKGYRFKELPARPVAKQPLAVEVHATVTLNWCCSLRRRQGVLAMAAPFGES